uniref:UDP-glucose 4,6-dehydratase n=1 Tax=Tetraselmis sp. GSL018 TaxID=582737 RepID=A0A061R6T4_9CHLO|mmetsp:Transcript_15714/g.37323  ORF Transcript_15714/g.37323 Transcript_15714/m.37323 type:complete len:317 (-) Transcript_15714:216-1166(-)|eukprot:CAMPEP_0177601308 /NCGR_PEP_ID=MMETSP0419_2-20121207/14170_1 /TAXON_ID=582737 /ORGANISM="Tetraselmis sp., Strain GSL018" /LENGTH=316 /DNA_ID=CAMNT_0019094525 /DNA_START=87 /DNA_END=1037 /DNA_ORIENTATION=+
MTGPNIPPAEPEDLKFLIYGGRGWIGGLLGALLKERGLKFEYGTARLEDRSAIMADIERVKPNRILNAAGVTGRPNVDWCETNRQTCVRGNVIGTLNLADVCDQMGIHMVYFGTGCIFHYDENFPEGSGKGFKETDAPNFTGSYYSHCKAMTENLLQAFNNVLTLRVRMPIVQDVLYPRNFITKIIKYQKIINIPNSMTVLPELLPMSIEMSRRQLTGIMNYTNPGAISHNEILQLYKEYIDPEFSWENFTVEEQAKVIVAPRSNNLLDTARIQSEFPEINGIRDSLIKHVFEPLSKHKDEVRAGVRAMREETRSA